MDMDNVIKLYVSPLLARALQFVCSAAKGEGYKYTYMSDSQYYLEVANEQIVATDGFRIHAVRYRGESSGLRDVPIGLYFLQGAPKTGMLDIAQSESKKVSDFPSYDHLLPSKQSKAQVCLDGKRIKDIAKGLDDDDRVFINIYEENDPIEVFINPYSYEVRMYALVTQVNDTLDTTTAFRPTKPTAIP